MKKLWLALALIFLLWSRPLEAAIAFVASGTAGSTSGTAVTATVTTTGANFIVVQMSSISTGALPALTDSLSNTWYYLPYAFTGSSGGSHFAYAVNATVGASQTFTSTCSGTCYPALVVWAFSGVDPVAPLDKHAENSSGNTTSCIPGSVTTTGADLVISGVSSGVAGQTAGDQTVTVVTSAISYQTNSGLDYGEGSAYLIQTSAGAASPTWTATGTQSFQSCISAAFRPTTTNPSGIAFVGKVSAASSNTTSITTAGLTTTGANFLVALVASANASPPTITDSLSNSWTATTQHGTAAAGGAEFVYATNPTVGAGQTFTATCSGSCYPSLIVLAFSGLHTTSVFDQVNGNSSGGSSPLATGSITPTAVPSLILTGMAAGQAATTSASQTVDSGMGPNPMYFQTGTASESYGGGVAWTVQSTAAAISPTWAVSALAGTQIFDGVIIACFKGTIPPPSTFSVLTLAP